MAIYSHSQLATFEQCPLKYKFQYIDRLDADHPTTIEAFMGHVVHETLYRLHRDLQFSKMNTLEEIIRYYEELWEKQYTDDILVVKGEYGPENYMRMGRKYVYDYYLHYAPFNDMRTVDLETQEQIDLPDGNKYHVRIDRLGCIGNTYYVCDYKTNLKMKSQEEAERIGSSRCTPFGSKTNSRTRRGSSSSGTCSLSTRRFSQRGAKCSWRRWCMKP